MGNALSTAYAGGAVEIITSNAEEGVEAFWKRKLFKLTGSCNAITHRKIQFPLKTEARGKIRLSLLTKVLDMLDIGAWLKEGVSPRSPAGPPPIPSDELMNSGPKRLLARPRDALYEVPAKFCLDGSTAPGLALKEKNFSLAVGTQGDPGF